MEVIILSLSILVVILVLTQMVIFLSQYAKKADLETHLKELKLEINSNAEKHSKQMNQIAEQLSGMIRQLEQSTDKKIVGLEHRRTEDNLKSKQEIIEHLSNGLSKLENTIREPLI